MGQLVHCQQLYKFSAPTESSIRSSTNLRNKQIQHLQSEEQKGRIELRVGTILINRLLKRSRAGNSYRTVLLSRTESVCRYIRMFRQGHATFQTQVQFNVNKHYCNNYIVVCCPSKRYIRRTKIKMEVREIQDKNKQEEEEGVRKRGNK